MEHVQFVWTDLVHALLALKWIVHPAQVCQEDLAYAGKASKIKMLVESNSADDRTKNDNKLGTRGCLHEDQALEDAQPCCF
jgi:hypothetical protein